MKKFIPAVSVALASALLLAVAGCNGGAGGGTSFHGSEEWLKKYDAPTAAYVLPERKEFGSVMVHDPSVFRDPVSGQFYAFGTHFNVATSPDLITWTQKARDGEQEYIYGNGKKATDVLTQGNEWTNGGASDTWAPDVEYIEGKYYMYVSMTSGFGSSKSIIVRVEADSPIGPFTNEQVIVRSDGSGKSNAIDPELFYDKEGKLWMVYGSAFGNLYVKELYATGKNAGLPVVSDPEAEDYLGKPVWRGSDNCEGPFIFYNAETDYYYMMISYGSLMTNYNMNVARSKSPDGPYEDITGANMASQGGGGNKLAGNYRFDGMAKGAAALGHNSVIKVDGKYIVVHHAREEEGSGNVTAGHHLETRQLFFNKDGWPVLAPNRYVGESLGVVPAEDIAGQYDIIEHTVGTQQTFAESVSYTFNADGTITGGAGGSWKLAENGYDITVTLGTATYEGVVVPQWCAYKSAPVLSITAMSTSTQQNGRALWANSAARTQA